MDSIDEKVDFFKKIVLDRIGKDYEELQNSLENSFQSEIAEYKIEAKQKSDNFIEQFVDKAKDEKERKVLETRRIKKDKILEVKNKLIDEIYQSVSKKAVIFIGTDEYYQLISQLIAQGKKELQDFESFKIILGESDYKNKEKINKIIIDQLDRKPLEFLKSEEDFDGGLIILNEDETIKLDLSLKSIILRNKFFIGNEVQRLLEENGDSNE